MEATAARTPYLKLRCFLSISSGTLKMKFLKLFRMRAAARTQKEGSWERPPERIPYINLDFLSRPRGGPDADRSLSSNPELQPHTLPVNRIPGGHPTSLKRIP